VPQSSPPQTWATRPCCSSCSTRSRPNRRSPPSPPTVPSAPESATCHRCPRCRSHHPSPQERQTLEAQHPGCSYTQRDPAQIETHRPDHLATMERVSPPKPRRDQDALRQAAGSAPLRARVRPRGRRVPGPCRRTQRLHRARHPRHGSRSLTMASLGRSTFSHSRASKRPFGADLPRVAAWPLPRARLRQR
jgi:hypothetical protein